MSNKIIVFELQEFKMHKTFLIFFIFATYTLMAQNFVDEQLKYKRVRTAKAEKDQLLKNEFQKCELSYPPKNIFIKIFKDEEVLELYVKESGSYQLFKTYPFCYASGTLGPKRKEGDLQVPEGFYYIDRFNPFSNYYLSLGINYPNRQDKKLSDPQRPGGDIFIHGNCVSIGCVAITDDLIKEVYWLATQAKSAGQQKIPVHIFPFELNNTFKMDKYGKQFPQHRQFWEELKETE